MWKRNAKFVIVTISSISISLYEYVLGDILVFKNKALSTITSDIRRIYNNNRKRINFISHDNINPNIPSESIDKATLISFNHVKKDNLMTEFLTKYEDLTQIHLSDEPSYRIKLLISDVVINIWITVRVSINELIDTLVLAAKGKIMEYIQIQDDRPEYCILYPGITIGNKSILGVLKRLNIHQLSGFVRMKQ